MQTHKRTSALKVKKKKKKKEKKPCPELRAGCTASVNSFYCGLCGNSCIHKDAFCPTGNSKLLTLRILEEARTLPTHAELPSFQYTVYPYFIKWASANVVELGANKSHTPLSIKGLWTGVCRKLQKAKVYFFKYIDTFLTTGSQSLVKNKQLHEWY